GFDPEKAVKGFPIAELLQFIHPEDQPEVRRKVELSMKHGEEYSAEYRLLHPDGGFRWVLARGRCTFSPDGTPMRFPGVSVDITQRKADELALKQNTEALAIKTERLRLAQDAGRIASWEWVIASGALIWDEGSHWTYNRPPSELVHVDQFWQYVHEDDRARVAGDLVPALEGHGEYRSEFRVRWPDGSIHWIDARGGPIFSADGKVVKIIGINMNVTDRKRAEQALIQNEKLAAVGRLAASIAHEINNPLEAVTNLFYLAKGSHDMEEAHAYLTVAESELQRVSAITSQTLRFHRQATRPMETTCAELFSSVLTIYNSRLKNGNITVEKRKRAHRSVLCLDGDIRQVLSNLIGNAVDSMQTKGGRLLVRSREGHDWKTGRPGIVLTVADTGQGMAPRVAERVFEAFFTTKGIGGTGLGMWISHEIVDRHQGKLSLKTSQRPGHSGTVFTHFLPFEAVILPSVTALPS
ncbi:MAG: PAS domain-containing protein, partial [Edaphobacter sp.]